MRWLVCELVAVYFLFAVGAIGGATKRATLEAIVAPLGEQQPPRWQRVAEAMDEGIGNPGPGYNIRRSAEGSSRSPTPRQLQQSGGGVGILSVDA